MNLHPVAGGPTLAFQRVATKANGKSALHLDLHVTDEGIRWCSKPRTSVRVCSTTCNRTTRSGFRWAAGRRRRPPMRRAQGTAGGQRYAVQSRQVANPAGGSPIGSLPSSSAGSGMSN